MSDIINSEILLHVKIDEDSQLLYKLSKIVLEYNLKLEDVIRYGILKLYDDIEFVRTVKNND